jgi:hypothetical protein
MFKEKTSTKIIHRFKKDNENRKSLALLAAERASPSIYKLVSSSLPIHARDCLRFFVLGCLGNAKSSQAKVATFMNSLAKEEKPDFILILGDNFYDWGVDSPLDFTFTSHFYNVYTNEAKVPHIANIPCFVILGNHDENLHHAKLKFQEEAGIPRGMHQVAHSYVGQRDSEYPTIESKINLYARDTLDVDHLPSWNMPSRFYSLVIQDTQLFCIDSNTYVKDFLNDYQSLLKPNQAIWLKENVDKAYRESKKIILALHHPPMVLNKRSSQSDVHLYLTDEEIKKVKNIFRISEKDIAHISYNELIRKVLLTQNIAFNLILSAHDHAIYYFNNLNSRLSDYPICQVTTGGGGGTLQERLAFSDHVHLGCYLEQHGFTEIIAPFNNDKISFNIYTPTSQLKFNNNSCTSIRAFPKKIDEREIKAIQTLCDIVSSALNDYFQLLNATQKKDSRKFLSKSFLKEKNLRYKQDDVKRAHKIWAYINHAQADDLLTTVNKICEILKGKGVSKNPLEESFKTILNKKLSEHYHNDTITIENLSQKIKEENVD